MNDREWRILLLGLLPGLRLSEIQRDRLWLRISAGLDPPAGGEKAQRESRLRKTEGKADGTKTNRI